MIALSAITQHEALHNVGELSALLAVMDSIGTQRILEIGTYRGGSAWAFSHIPGLEHIVTVDTTRTLEAGRRLADLPCRIDMVSGNSLHPDTRHQVKMIMGDHKADVVFIDGGHLYKEAREDFEHYGQYGRPGGLIVLHDTQGHPATDAVQVPKLWAELAVVYRTTEFIDHLGGPGGTGLVWL